MEKRMDQLTDIFSLRNGQGIPCVGYGTWRVKPEEAVASVQKAVEVGYRHIDAAAIYRNEPEVGKGIATCGVKREDLFITSKVWNTERGYETTLAAFDKTCKDLGVDCLDLYLIHWPANSKQFPDTWDQINQDTWRAMSELYQAGKIKAIGVSNFLPKHLKSLMEMDVKPMVNQIRFHPGMMQKEIVDYCVENGILVEAWSPLGQGKVMEDETIAEIAKKYGKTPAQIALRWILQHDILPLTRSVNPERIEDNAKLFDFELGEEDMKKIDALDEGEIVDSDNTDL